MLFRSRDKGGLAAALVNEFGFERSGLDEDALAGALLGALDDRIETAVG